MKSNLFKEDKYDRNLGSIKLAESVGYAPIVKKDKDGKIRILFPLEVDLRDSIENNFIYEMRIVTPDMPQQTNFVELEPREVSDNLLGRLGVLSGQENEISSIGKRIRQERDIFGDKSRGTQLKSENILSRNSKKEKNTSSAAPSRKGQKPLRTKSKQFLLKMAIQRGDSRRLDSIRINSARILKNYSLDYTSFVSNAVVQSIANLTDEQAFGKRKIYSLSNNSSESPGNSGQFSTINLASCAFPEKPSKLEQSKNKNNPSEIPKAVSLAASFGSDMSKIDQIGKNITGDADIESIADGNQTNLSQELLLRNILELSADDLNKNEIIAPSAKSIDNINVLEYFKNQNKESHEHSILTDKYLRNRTDAVKQSDQSLEKDISANKKSSSIKREVVKIGSKSMRRQIKEKKTHLEPLSVESQKVIHQRINEMYSKGIDPASSFEPSFKTHLTKKDEKRGRLSTRLRTNKKISKGKIRKLSESGDADFFLKTKERDAGTELVSEILPFRPFKIKSLGDDLGQVDVVYQVSDNNFPKVVEQEISNRKKVIYFEYLLEDSHVFGGKIYTELVTKNRRNFILNVKRKPYEVEKLIREQLSVLQAQPTIRVFNNKETKYTKGIISNPNNVAISFKVYRKKISSSRSPTRSMFEHVTSGRVGPKSSENVRMLNVSNETFLYRMTYSARVGGRVYTYNNFATDRTKSLDRVSRHNGAVISLVQDKRQPGVVIYVTTLPYDTTSIRVERRKILGRGRRTSFSSPSVNASFKELHYSDGTPVGSIPIDNPTAGVMLLDEDVRDGTFYEYRVVSIGKSARENILHARRRIRYHRAENLVEVGIVKSGGKPPGRESGLFPTFYFALSLQKKGKTLFDEVLGTISSQEFELFKDSLDQLRSLSKTLVRARVEVVNIETGKSTLLGEDFRNGDTFGFKPRTYSNFIVLVKPYIINSSELIDKLRSTLSDVPENLQFDGDENLPGSINRSVLSNFKRSANQIARRNNKKYSKSAFKRGYITSPEQDAESISSKYSEETLTGDNMAFTVSVKDKLKFKTLFKSSKVMPDNRVVLYFDVMDTNSRRIDFYQIIAKKEGAFFPVGTCHSTEDDRVVGFIDYTNQEFIGQIDYYVQGTTEFGTVTKMNRLCRVTLYDPQVEATAESASSYM